MEVKGVTRGLLLHVVLVSGGELVDVPRVNPMMI